MIFNICRGQIIVTGMGDVIDINILAVKAVMDLYDIDNQKACLEKVMRLFHFFQQNRKKSNEDCVLESL